MNSNSISKFIAISGTPVSMEKPILDTGIKRLAGALAPALESLLVRKNGFFCFESALYVFSSNTVGFVPGLLIWNEDTLWRKAYGDLADEKLFFAEDIFGDQFCIYNNNIWKFESETGAITYFARDIEEWAQELLLDYNLHTGYSLAHEWQQRFGLLPITDRLLPKQLFILGGPFEVQNLYPIDRVKGMQFRGHIAQQIKNIPDQSAIRIKIE